MDNMDNENGDDETAILGEDVVLREREQLTELLDLLPLRAQLGFSGLKEKWNKRGDKGLKDMISAAAKTNDPLMVEYTCLDVTSKTLVFGSNLGIVYLYDRATRRLSKFVCDVSPLNLFKTPVYLDLVRVICGYQVSGNSVCCNPNSIRTVKTSTKKRILSNLEYKLDNLDSNLKKHWTSEN